MTSYDPQRLNLPQAFLRMCRRNLFRNKLADTTGIRLSGGELLSRTLVLRRLLLRHVLGPDEKFVGLLLPPSVAGVVANAAVTLAGRVPVNLNFTTPADVLDGCIHRCGIRHVLTARKVLERLPLEPDAECVFLEDFRQRVRLVDKLVAAIQTYATPAALLDRLLRLTRIQGSDLMTVIFTSGSTGIPKGVMLSYDNIASNVAGMGEVANIRSSDTFLGVLPLFHAFGFTCTVWAVLVLDVRGAYHVNPLEAQQVGRLCEKEKVTFVIGTPTLLRNYLRRCTPENFRSVEVVIGGAEKMPLALFDAFQQKFGVRPIEGYGATELSPFVSVNVPPDRAIDPSQVTVKEGTVGRPLPRIEAKVVDLDTGADLAAGQRGMLRIRGPNVMLGYFQEPGLTSGVLRDGWYVTGDVASIDADGFITLEGRESRFAKIGGEMVPHLKVEEALAEALGAGEDELQVAVTSVPDPRKGERLIVVHKPLPEAPGDICRKLARQGLPNLWIPAPDDFLEVPELPLLGTGKIDMRRLNELVRQRLGAASR